MNKNDYYLETNEKGIYKVYEKGSTRIKVLKKASVSYAKRTEERKKRIKLQEIEKNKKMEKEKLIQNKMREIAIQQLKEEGIDI